MIPTFVLEVLRSLMKRPCTRMYPFVKTEPPKGFRGKMIFHVDRCISCGVCEKVCPAFAIEMVELDEKRRPLFHLGRCIYCYQCVESCPTSAIEGSKIYELADTVRDPTM